MPSNADATIFESPNAKELVWFTIFIRQSIIHIENSIIASNKAEDLVFNGTLTGITNGKADAFRHAFWNALGSAKFETFIMKLFADAHEYGETGMATQMDFYNNSKGRGIGENYNMSTGNNVISNAVLQALTNGQLKYISPLGLRGYILPNSQLIPTNQ